MNDNVLKKEFKEKDIERVRNIVKGKHGESTIKGIGYQKPEIEHKENDIWEEDNKLWTIKNGIKQNITKYSSAVKKINLPLFCPECKTPLKPSIDRLIYYQHNCCMNCLTVKETQLKIEGKWEEYQKNIHNNDIDNLIKEVEEYYELLINKKDIFITEAGDTEQWTEINTNILEEQKKQAIEYLEKLKK